MASSFITVSSVLAWLLSLLIGTIGTLILDSSISYRTKFPLSPVKSTDVCTVPIGAYFFQRKNCLSKLFLYVRTFESMSPYHWQSTVLQQKIVTHCYSEALVICQRRSWHRKMYKNILLELGHTLHKQISRILLNLMTFLCFCFNKNSKRSSDSCFKVGAILSAPQQQHIMNKQNIGTYIVMQIL